MSTHNVCFCEEIRKISLLFGLKKMHQAKPNKLIDSHPNFRKKIGRVDGFYFIFF